MMVLLKNVFGQIFSKFGILVVLVLGGLCVPIVFQLITFAKDFDPQRVVLVASQRVKAMAPVKGQTTEEINQRLLNLRAERDRKLVEREALRNERCFLPPCKFINSGKLYRIDVELDLLDQAIAFGETLRDGPDLCKKWRFANARLNQLNIQNQLLMAAKPWWAPTSSAHQAIKDEIPQLEKTAQSLGKACSKSIEISKEFEGKVSQGTEKIHSDFLKMVKEIKEAKDDLWVAILEVLPAALSALVGIIVMPWVVSAVSFYGVAPLATRRFGVQLAPDSTGVLNVEAGSEKSLKVSLRRGWEVLVDPGLVDGMPRSAVASSRLFFDRSMPLTSLVCGLYRMTNIRSEQDVEITISARQSAGSPNGTVVPEPTEIAVLDLPENSAMVLQPRCLVGVIQQIDKPMRITKHWQAGNLSSWLTMQLRYIVFHGPAKLIVRGNGGVRAGLASEEFSVNQAATLGFSANLRYGVSRCEPFDAYLSGKKELFDDRFSAGPGYYVREVSPVLVEGGPIRRPWEVLINAFLKGFGL